MTRIARRPALVRLAALVALPALALVYTAPAPAAKAATPAELEALATGAMQALEVHETPRAAPLEAVYYDADGAERRLAEHRGRVVVVNFWATWCAPCVREMPALDRLAGALAGTEADVVALSADFGDISRPAAFYERTGIEHLALYHDRDKAVARGVGVQGLPVTLILDREGREVARLTGDAHWDSPEAMAVIRALLDAPAG